MRLIYAESLINNIENNMAFEYYRDEHGEFVQYCKLDDVVNMINDQFGIIPAPEHRSDVHAHWTQRVLTTEGIMVRTCSMCKCSFTMGNAPYFYCPHCGAKMDGKVSKTDEVKKE